MAYITINKNNYFYNLDRISEKVVSKNQIFVVLKDNAYGHGLLEIANLSKEYGISKAVVRRVSEAEKIAHLFSEILILAPEKIIDNSKFLYTINSLEDLTKYNQNHRLELKIDTGMHRVGIQNKELEIALQEIEEKNLNLHGVFTHYRDSDVLNSSYFWQKTIFQDIKDRTIKFCNINKKHKTIEFHSNNSAGVFRTKNIIKDESIRVGIATYGYLPKNNIFNFPKLKPVLSLYGELINFYIAKKGNKIGYGGIFEIDKEQFIGIYDIGYSDGFRRISKTNIRNKQFTTVDNYYLLGQISMDSMALNSNKQIIQIFNSVSNLAKIFNTIEYEILVNLSKNIKRVLN